MNTLPPRPVRSRRTRIRAVARVLAAVALIATGCGPDADDAEDAPPGARARDTATAAAGTALTTPVPPPADAGAVEAARASLPPAAQAVSFLGAPLEPPPLSDEVRADHEEKLARAEVDLDAAPDDADALIWYGRRLAYLGRYRDAIDTYTRALELHPDDARLYRHRGHRWISVREPGRAVADLRHAAELVEGSEDEVEPDGLPNALGIPTSTLHFNIFYHLGLAHYIRGEFPQALLAWNECMEVSKHPDSVVATAYWLNNVMSRLGLDERADALLADVHADMEIVESTSYLDVLLLWKGEREPSDLRAAAGDESALAGVTTEYGIGAWHFAEGRRERAFEIWEAIVERRADQWPAFGYIAAEAELARMERADPPR